VISLGAQQYTGPLQTVVSECRCKGGVDALWLRIRKLQSPEDDLLGVLSRSDLRGMSHILS
jgi:hypothetical protein